MVETIKKDVKVFINRLNIGSLSTKKLNAWIFILPGLFFTILLKYIPICTAVYYSLFNYDINNPPGEFLGLSNYIKLFTSDSFFVQAWKNTGVFLLLTLLMVFMIPIIQAIFLSEIVRWRNIFSAVYILPAMIPGTIYIVLWKWIWNPQFGLANYLISFAGLPPQSWLSDTFWTKFCIIFPSILGGGFMVLYYLSAILSISRDIYEAAMLDGCTGWRKIFHITLPNIKFLIFINLILCVIGVMQEFDKPFQYTKGGPSGAALNIGIYIYQQFFDYLNLGRSSAAAVVLFIVIAILTIIQRKLDNENS